MSSSSTVLQVSRSANVSTAEIKAAFSAGVKIIYVDGGPTTPPIVVLRDGGSLSSMGKRE